MLSTGQTVCGDVANYSKGVLLEECLNSLRIRVSGSGDVDESVKEQAGAARLEYLCVVAGDIGKDVARYGASCRSRGGESEGIKGLGGGGRRHIG